MRTLWSGHRTFPSRDTAGAAWLDALGPRLIANGEFELCNVSWGKGGVLGRQDDGPIQQRIVQPVELGRDGLPSGQIVAWIMHLRSGGASSLRSSPA